MIKDRIWTLVSRKLSGEATASELLELDNWVKSQPDADLYLQIIAQYWNTLPEADEEFLEATYHLHLNRLRERGYDLEAEKEEPDALYLQGLAEPRSRKLSGTLFIAFSILASFGLIFFFLYRTEKAAVSSADTKIAQSEVSTKSGSRTRIQLPDGSSVWLNGSSKLIYDNKNFGNTFRQVTLSGEAYFDIVKNPEKPFIIHTPKMDIKVLGTAFNVKAYPGENNIETSLIRGSIEVTINGRREKIMMKPNDKLIVKNEATAPDTTGKISMSKTTVAGSQSLISMAHLTLSRDSSTIVETAWVDNKLIFDNESFEDVAIKMERWYGVNIRFAENKLKSIRMTGTFEKETVTEALDALKLLSRFNYKIKNEIITIAK